MAAGGNEGYVAAGKAPGGGLCAANRRLDGFGLRRLEACDTADRRSALLLRWPEN